MVRIFDSMVYEDEVTDDLMLGIAASGELDGNQTRQAMSLGCIYVEPHQKKHLLPFQGSIPLLKEFQVPCSC